MSDESKWDSDESRDKEARLFVEYMEALGADMRVHTVGAIRAMAHAIGAVLGVGLTIPAGKKPEDIIESVIGLIGDTIREEFLDMLKDEQRQKETRQLIGARVASRLLERLSKPKTLNQTINGDTVTQTVQITAPADSTPEQLLEMARSLGSGPDRELVGLAVIGPDGTVLATEGNVPTESLPKDAKAGGVVH